MTPIRLIDGLKRPVKATPAAVTAALLGPTSLVSDVDSDITITYREDAEEVDVSATGFYQTFNDTELSEAVRTFLGMVSVSS
jgi:hypothetical protein